MIFSDEVRLTARRYPMQERMALDETGRRIDRLREHYLVKLGAPTMDGDTLYRDPKDGRFWEYLCPPATEHGDSLPELRCLSSDEAQRKYGSAAAVR